MGGDGPNLPGPNDTDAALRDYGVRVVAYNRNHTGRTNVILTTTNAIEGRPVSEYLGVVTGESILGANIGRDIGAMFRNVTGGRVSGYEKELRNARDIALQEMQEAAQALGAEAIIGIDIDYETVGGQMLMVTSSGTAVRF
jgi:uncharacterized protein YbjQ (UPF0145 family)